MATCARCRREVREVNDQKLCLECRIDLKTNDLSLGPSSVRSRPTTLLSSREGIPLLKEVVHAALTVETVAGRLFYAKMRCSLETREYKHKFSFDSKEVTCTKCLKALSLPSELK